MVTYRDLVSGFRQLGLSQNSRVIAHASLSAFGEVVGGADTIVGALVASFETVIMPTFTFRTMVVPPVGPADNALDYSPNPEGNSEAEFYRTDMPADRSMGQVAETLRLHPEAMRSMHPALSFSGIDAEKYLEKQTLEEPLAPIGALAEADGDVLLLGVDHRANASIHYAEQQSARRQFVRWALTPRGIVECPGWPGCSDGFNSISSRLLGMHSVAVVGAATLESVPLRDLIHLVSGWIRQDPQALLCNRPTCPHCSVVRASVEVG